MDRILSLDVSSLSTGWAFVPSIQDYSGLEYGLIKTKPKYSRPRRLYDFRTQLLKLLRWYEPTLVVIEDVYSGPNVKSLIVLSKFAGVVEECCFSACNVEPYVIHNKTVKAYFKAKDKTNTFEAIISVLEWEDKDLEFKKHNDITDAIAQLICYCDCILEGKECKIEKEYGFLYEV